MPFLVGFSHIDEDLDKTFELEPPRPIRARLHEDGHFKNTVTSWSFDGLHGEFGTQPWLTLNHHDVWDIHLTLMNRDNVEHWVNLGRLMLMFDRQRDADRAFSRARRIDEDHARQHIADAHTSVDAWKAVQAEKAQAIRDARLRTTSPEAAPYPNAAWPPLSATDRTRMELELRATIEDAALGVGGELPQTTDLLMTWSDLDEGRTRAAVRALTDTNLVLSRLFDLPMTNGEYDTVFAGKVAVLLVATRDRFALLEMQQFDYESPEGVLARCHFDEPHPIIVAWPGDDPIAFRRALVRMMTHAFMHRMVSPRRLPPWANEGLAVHASILLDGESGVDEGRRHAARLALLGTDPLDDVLNQTYVDVPTDADIEAIGAVGALFVEHLLRLDRDAFTRWARRAKSPIEDADAMKDTLGMSPAALAEQVREWYRVNE